MSDEACAASTSASDENPRVTPPTKTKEEIEEENARFNQPVCPCEEEEAEPQSEYDVSGDWVSYTGEINSGIFENAARFAEEEISEQIRRTLNVSVSEPGVEDEGELPNDQTRRLSADATASDSSQAEEGGAYAVIADENDSEDGPRSDFEDDGLQFLVESAMEQEEEQYRQAQACARGSDANDSFSEEEIDLDPFYEEAAYWNSNKWDVIHAEEKAKHAAEVSWMATESARATRREADEAELAGAPTAAFLASKFRRLDKWARSAIKEANKAERQAVLTRHAWQQNMARQNRFLQAPSREPVAPAGRSTLIGSQLSAEWQN